MLACVVFLALEAPVLLMCSCGCEVHIALRPSVNPALGAGAWF